MQVKCAVSRDKVEAHPKPDLKDARSLRARPSLGQPAPLGEYCFRFSHGTGPAAIYIAIQAADRRAGLIKLKRRVFQPWHGEARCLRGRGSTHRDRRRGPLLHHSGHGSRVHHHLCDASGEPDDDSDPPSPLVGAQR